MVDGAIRLTIAGGEELRIDIVGTLLVRGSRTDSLLDISPCKVRRICLWWVGVVATGAHIVRIEISRIIDHLVDIVGTSVVGRLTRSVCTSKTNTFCKQRSAL